MCESDMTDIDLADLLHLELWRDIPDGVEPKAWLTKEARARKLIVKHTGRPDPYRLATRAWADLPPHTKAALDPIRKKAERPSLQMRQSLVRRTVQQTVVFGSLVRSN